MNLERKEQPMAEKTLNLMLPGNPRYQPKELVPIFGYDNLYQGLAEVEIANLKALGKIGLISEQGIALLTSELCGRLLGITTTEVDKVERAITKHDVRAWVRLAQEVLPPELGRWVHVPLTSYDALDTGRILQYCRAWGQALRPAIIEVMELLIKLVEAQVNTVQIGRTHGQHALPITVGFWLATILNRIVYNAHEMDNAVMRLVGKISGAVGAYNAQVGLGLNQVSLASNSTSYEGEVLRFLNLEAAPISTQILPPEPLEYFLHACLMMSAAFGQLGNDCRHLMRSEIGEVTEAFETGQVGSSTMAHKRNPVNFEGVVSMWKKNVGEFVKVLMTLHSEHQRDLTDSAVMRDFPVILVNLMTQLNTLRKKDKNDKAFLSRMAFNGEALYRNLTASGNVILAEPTYIVLQMAGFEGDAHELVNRTLVPRSGAEPAAGRYSSGFCGQ
jgi:adenylosuccinate lyase